MDKVQLRIVGGTSFVEDNRTTEDLVNEECRRRLKEAGVDQHRRQAMASGGKMRADIRRYVMQVQFAADALSQLSPLPADFRSDGYWPERLKVAEVTRSGSRHRRDDAACASVIVGLVPRK